VMAIRIVSVVNLVRCLLAARGESQLTKYVEGGIFRWYDGRTQLRPFVSLNRNQLHLNWAHVFHQVSTLSAAHGQTWR
jgi:hypothetical protein